MISPDQCRAARILAKVSALSLAEQAGVGIATVKRFEGGQAVSPASIEKIAATLTAAGISFIANGEKSVIGGEGVRLTGRAG